MILLQYAAGGVELSAFLMANELPSLAGEARNYVVSADPVVVLSRLDFFALLPDVDASRSRTGTDPLRPAQSQGEGVGPVYPDDGERGVAESGLSLFHFPEALAQAEKIVSRGRDSDIIVVDHLDLLGLDGKVCNRP